MEKRFLTTTRTRDGEHKFSLCAALEMSSKVSEIGALDEHETAGSGVHDICSKSKPSLVDVGQESSLPDEPLQHGRPHVYATTV